eukprot:1160000-Pelagomonas_calceolata.AAC.1
MEQLERCISSLVLFFVAVQKASNVHILYTQGEAACQDEGGAGGSAGGAQAEAGAREGGEGEGEGGKEGGGRGHETVWNAVGVVKWPSSSLISNLLLK